MLDCGTLFSEELVRQLSLNQRNRASGAIREDLQGKKGAYVTGRRGELGTCGLEDRP